MVPFTNTKNSLISTKDLVARAAAKAADDKAQTALNNIGTIPAEVANAITTAGTAVTTANEAKVIAQQAQATADEAITIAESAQAATNDLIVRVDTDYVRIDGTTPITGPQLVEGDLTSHGKVTGTTGAFTTAIDGTGVKFPDNTKQATAAFSKNEINTFLAQQAGLINTAQTKADAGFALANQVKVTADAAAPQATTYTKTEIDYQLASLTPGGGGTIDSGARVTANDALSKATTANSRLDTVDASLLDLASKSSVYTKAETDAQINAGNAGDLKVINNLSDLSDKSVARTNLGLGSSAVLPATDFATAAQGTTADNTAASLEVLRTIVQAQGGQIGDVAVDTAAAVSSVTAAVADVANMQATVQALSTAVAAKVTSVRAGSGGVSITGTTENPIVNVIPQGYTDAQIDSKVATLTSAINQNNAAINAVDTKTNTAQSTANVAMSTAEAGVLAAAVARKVADLAAPQATTYTKSNVDAFVNSLSTQLSLETSRAQTAETSLQNAINFITSNVDASAIDSITEVITAFQNADAGINGALTALTTTTNAKIAAEEAARMIADTQLHNKVNQEIADRIADVDAEQVRAEAAETLLTNNLNQEIADRIADVNAEEVRALAAELVLRDDLAAEVAARILDVDTEQARAEAAELVLTNNLNQEIADRITDVNAEETRALAAELVLRNDLAAEVANRIADVNAEEAARIADVDAEETRALAAELVLRNDLASEVANRTADVDAEETRAIAAEAVLQTNINSEATARSNADTTLTNDLNSEITNRTNADTTLQNNINTEAITRASADTTLTNNLAAEVTRATNAENTKVNRSGDTMTGDLVSKTSGSISTNWGNISGSVAVDFSASEYFVGTCVGNVSFSFTNPYSTTRIVIVKLTNPGSYTISFPGGTKFTKATAPAFTTGIDTLAIEYNSVSGVYFVHLIGKLA